MKNVGGVIAALLGGAAIGAVIGILFAPEKGSDTRLFIADTFEDTKERVKEALRKKGITLSNKEIEDLVDDMQAEG